MSPSPPQKQTLKKPANPPTYQPSVTQTPVRSVHDLNALLATEMQRTRRYFRDHPTLSTTLSNNKIQDVILQHPVTRMLEVPQADLDARARTFDLLRNVIKATVIALNYAKHTIQSAPNGGHLNFNKNAYVRGGAQQSSLQTSPLVRELVTSIFNVHKQMGDGGPMPPPNTVPVIHNNDENVLIDLATMLQRLMHMRDVLEELLLRIQGVCCYVYWNTWDSVFEMVAEVAGLQDTEAAAEGRLFRAAGPAAMYRQRKKLEKSHAEETRRRSQISKPGKELPRTRVNLAAIKKLFELQEPPIAQKHLNSYKVRDSFQVANFNPEMMADSGSGLSSYLRLRTFGEDELKQPLVATDDDDASIIMQPTPVRSVVSDDASCSPQSTKTALTSDDEEKDRTRTWNDLVNHIDDLSDLDNNLSLFSRMKTTDTSHMDSNMPPLPLIDQSEIDDLPMEDMSRYTKVDAGQRVSLHQQIRMMDDE
ncbi:hypothetical protein CJU90_4702 [Yarrowia sp. C11]|nr:hypothetical protein CJU90_4702 [Yarrowia sp. C11]KAG5370638.1 hypothetical protein CKK34_0751 [Yarrowia sp. E02]